jgi:poly(A) polymerase
MLIPSEVFALSAIVKNLRPDAEIRLVGGFIRDNLLGLNPSEVDLSCNLPPKDLIQIFQKSNITAIPTGLAHGTITVVYNKKPFEITSLRRDISCDGRKALVDFTKNWEVDAARRDFSMNALYLDLNNTMYDYFNGQQDLAEQRVKFIGDPQARIEEDYLRLLRYFRFLAYFEHNNFDTASLEAAIALKSGLTKLSIERVQKEVFKLLSLPYPLKSLQLIVEYHLLDFFWSDAMYEVANFAFSQNPLLNFTALLYKNHVKLDLCNLKLSKANTKTITFLLHCDQSMLADLYLDPNKNQLIRLLHNYGVEKTIALIDFATILFAKQTNTIQTQIVKSLLNEVLETQYHPFPLSGIELQKLGFQGAAIGAQLKRAKNLWLNSNCTLELQSLVEWLKNNN